MHTKIKLKKNIITNYCELQIVNKEYLKQSLRLKYKTSQ